MALPPQKTNLTSTDLMDMHLFLTGFHQWREQQGLETFYDPAEFGLQHTDQIPSAPLTSIRHFELVDKLIDDNEGTVVGDLNEMNPECVNKIREHFQKVGLEKFLEDGLIEKDELLIAASEMGKGAMLEKGGEKYTPSQEGLEAAKNLLAKHGIYDPDGSMAQGLAAHSERLTQMANEGLGIAPAPTLSRANVRHPNLQ